MYSLLVVSDNNSIHSFFKKSLNRDCTVLTAKTSGEALQIFLKREIDVAFLDILLKDNGADRLLEELRQANIDPTVVALIPASQPMLSEEALRVGAYELLETPLKKEAVLQTSRRALERHELKRELDFVQLQLNKLKPGKNGNGVYEFTYSKQASNSNLHFTYKEVFQKFSKTLTHVYDLRKLADLTVEALTEIFRVGKVVFMMIDQEKGVSRPYRCLGFDEVAAQSLCFPTNHGTTMWLTENHQILNKEVIDREVATNRLSNREAINMQREINLLQAQLCIPIFAKGNLVSVIALGNKITGKPFFDEDIELLSMLAGYIGMAVENAMLYKEVYLKKIHNENVLENIPCGVIVINNDCKINSFNKTAAMMLNISSNDVLGKNVKYIGSIFADIILRTLKDKKVYTLSEIVHPTTHSTYAVSTSLLSDNGKELGAIMVFTDLSEIKKLELMVKDLEKQAFYNMLSKNMAHYIKNNLVPVKTFIDLFPERRAEKEFVEEFFPVVREKVSMLNLMAEKLTTLSENDRLAKGRVDLRLALDRVLDVYSEKMKKLNIKLIKRYTEEPTSTHVNFQKLEEAFSNIVLNAIESMPNGGSLTITLSRLLLGNGKLEEECDYPNNGRFADEYFNAKAHKKLLTKYIEITVQDTGIGIPQGELKNIFLPFYTTKTFNIGLGLPVAQRIIEEHAGSIYVSSKESRGSNFQILLPICNS